MKKLFYFILICSISCIYAQVDYETKIASNYIQFATFDSEVNDFRIDTEREQECVLSPDQEYYVFSCGGEEVKVGWEYQEELSEGGMDTYVSEAAEKIVFNYDSQQIWFFTDWDNTGGYYKEVMILAQLQAFEK